METQLRPLWARFFKFNWKFGLILILIICIPRFILVLYANSSGNYSLIALIMVISALVPFVFLSKAGRKQIGITRSENLNGLVIALIAGAAGSMLLYLAGEILYGTSYDNWYNYIGKSYNIPTDISHRDKNILFFITAITGITFSPIGEELFFRGIVHSSFEESIGRKRASIVDGAAFALTHISHFGLVFINDQWSFRIVPTIIWVLSMFFVSLLFILLKRYSGSILGAIIGHATFNLGMIYCIFYL